MYSNVNKELIHRYSVTFCLSVSMCTLNLKTSVTQLEQKLAETHAEYVETGVHVSIPWGGVSGLLAYVHVVYMPTRLTHRHIKNQSEAMRNVQLLLLM